MTIHFANLSRGLDCPHFRSGDLWPPKLFSPPRMLRLQSTHCEQKLWEKILQNLGPEFLAAAAVGEVIVHDVSERDRETRAMWQGLSWVRYALHASWLGYGELYVKPTFTDRPRLIARKEYSRHGMMVSRYWEQQYRMLSKSTINELKYYRQYFRPTGTSIPKDFFDINVRSCWGMK